MKCHNLLLGKSVYLSIFYRLSGAEGAGAAA